MGFVMLGLILKHFLTEASKSSWGVLVIVHFGGGSLQSWLSPFRWSSSTDARTPSSTWWPPSRGRDRCPKSRPSKCRGRGEAFLRWPLVAAAWLRWVNFEFCDHKLSQLCCFCSVLHFNLFYTHRQNGASLLVWEKDLRFPSALCVP